jgi:hypothetical protein
MQRALIDFNAERLFLIHLLERLSLPTTQTARGILFLIFLLGWHFTHMWKAHT